MTTIGQKIKAAREAKGWTQAKLAEEMGYDTYVTISRHENDVYKPSSRALMAYERVLGRILK